MKKVRLTGVKRPDLERAIERAIGANVDPATRRRLAKFLVAGVPQ